MTLNLELRSISVNAALSQETNCYSAKLYLDGKHVADVSNHGHGGCDNQYPVKGFDLNALNAKIKATYPKIDELTPDIELVCGEMVDRFLTIRQLRRSMKKNILFNLPGDSKEAIRQFGGKLPLTPESEKRCISQLQAKYPTATILNTMTDDQIWQLVK